jgi:hypothetical protein
VQETRRQGTDKIHRQLTALNERDADSKLAAPNGAAGHMQSVARHYQYEFLRDSGLAGYLQSGSGTGEVADQTIDSAPADELDRCGF